jgi:hypothetical protein
MLELQTSFDAQNIALLQKENKELKDALKAEQERAEKHAEALTGIQRTCDGVMQACENRIDDIKAQHAAVIHVKETLLAKLEKDKADLQAQVTVFQAQATTHLTHIHAAVTASRTLEIHPVRPDRRQFAQWHTGPVPACGLVFDRAWCAAVCGKAGKVDIDAATRMRAHVTQQGEGCLTFRSAAPLPRRLSSLPLVSDGHQQEQLPACRIVVEAYGQDAVCVVGLLPSHYPHDEAAVTPVSKSTIWNYGGWWMIVGQAPGFVADAVKSGWAVLQPLNGTAAAAAGGTSSAYATTAQIPPVPPGSAVEFAVDYAAGTCRVAFYTPAAVAGGFVEAPHAKMELRFVATQASKKRWLESAASAHPATAAALFKTPARSVPTLADSGVELHAAATIVHAGVILRLAST